MKTNVKSKLGNLKKEAAKTGGGVSNVINITSTEEEVGEMISLTSIIGDENVLVPIIKFVSTFIYILLIRKILTFASKKMYSWICFCFASTSYISVLRNETHFLY